MGWAVTLSALGVNLALGVLYTWSAFAHALTLPASYGGQHLWTAQQAYWPHVFTVGCFALTMVFAGRLQDRVGPRWVATAGGAMIGLGMIIASLSPARLASQTAFPFRMVLGFGVFTGVGIGLAYAAATPAAIKWFLPRRRGLVTGVVVSGFALASLFTGQHTALLIGAFGVSRSFLFLGVVLFIAIAGLSQFLANPPKGYVPPGSYSEDVQAIGPQAAVREHTWRQVVRTPSFYLLWMMFVCAVFSALLVIELLSKVALARLGVQATVSAGVVLVAAVALGDAFGRPLGGLVSDRFGRQRTLLGVFVAQAALIVGMRFAGSASLLVSIAFLIGLNYGATLTLFPATAFDFFGTRNAGADYGLVFTAWGVGALLGPHMSTWVLDRGGMANAGDGRYVLACAIAAALCLLGAGLTVVIRPPDRSELGRVVEPGAVRQA